MSDIFISYSRRDLDFAGRIVETLAKNNLDTWVDWKSIPKGEDWQEEIYRGIEQADIFLFLVSEDSVTSRPCNDEITHALKNGKRILPIFIARVENKQVYMVTEKFLVEENKKEINRRNFIFCREGMDDFDRAVEVILTTVHSDYEWLKVHTELQMKALKWEKHKDDARLLRGRELSEVEEQLNRHASGADPTPTLLQHQFVLSSRKHQSRQRRRLGIGILAALISITLISFVAKNQWDEAKIQRATAQAESTARAQAQQKEQAQRGIALSRNLAEQGRRLGLPDTQNFTGRDSSNGNAKLLATLLAIESVRRNPTLEGNQALVNQLSQLPLAAIQQHFTRDGLISPAMLPGDEEPDNIYLNSDQTRVVQVSVVDGKKYQLHVWSLPDWEEKVVDFLVPDVTGLSYRSPVLVSTDTNWVASIGKSGIDLQPISGDSSQTIWETEGPYSALRFSPDSKFLLAARQDGTIKTWDVKSGQETGLIYMSPGAEDVHFIGNGPLIAVETTLIGDNQHDVYIFDAGSGRELNNFPNSRYLGSTDSGDLVALSFGDHYEPTNIHIWDPASNREHFVIENECLLGFIPGTKNILTASKGENGSCLSGMGNPVHIYDLNKKQIVFEAQLDDVTWATKISPSGDLAAISTGQTILVLDVKENKVIIEIQLDFMADTFVFSPDHSIMAIANRSPLPMVGGMHSFDTVIWDLVNNVALTRIPNDSFASSIEFMDGGGQIMIVDSKGRLNVWNINEYWQQKVFEFQHDQPAAMPGSVADAWDFAVSIFSPSGKQLAVGGGNGNLETFEFPSTRELFSFAQTDMTLSEELAYSPDEKWLAFTGLFCQQGSCPNNVKILDLENNLVFVIDQMEPTYIADLAFSPDGRYLAVMWSGDRNLLHIWDTSQWELIKEIDTGPQGSRIVNVAFNQAGDRLVLTNPGEEGYLLLLDVANWENIYELKTPSGPFTVDDDRMLAVTSYDTENLKSTLRLINMATNQDILSFQEDGQFRVLSFNSDGEYLSAVDIHDGLWTWETSSGHLVSTKFIPDIGSSLLASPDHPSWMILSSGEDILIVDVINGTEIERISTGEYVSSLSLSPDGRLIASGGGDGKAQVWYWRPEDFVEEACGRLARNLTQAEWNQYLGSEPYRPTCPNLPALTE